MSTCGNDRGAFKGQKGDHEQNERVPMRTRSELRGSEASFTADSGVVAAILEMLELRSCLLGLPDHDPSPGIVIARLALS